ncbi:MAG: glycosyltransferase, partial [Pseudomonadaceae bacterium]
MNPLPLLIFAKAPISGQVKTRLIPALGADGACALYTRLLRHTLMQTAAWPGQRFLYCAPDTQHPTLLALAKAFNLQLRSQHGEDLGMRMHNALAEHPGGALLIGTDCPELTCSHLHQAADALVNRHSVFLPSEDGGYVLVGQQSAHPAPFTDMRWSQPDVMAQSLLRLEAAGLSTWLGPTLWDLDEPADLPRL